MTWHPEEGQPGPGRGLAALATGLALALALAGAAIFYIEFRIRSGAAPPHWVPGAVSAWLTANGLPLVAAGALVVGMLGMLAVRAARRGAALAPAPVAADDATVERLRRQIEPLATGDLAIRLPEAEGAVGEITRTLRVLVGGVSDLAATADEAADQLLGAVQDGRAGLGGLQVEVERGRSLADEVAQRAGQAAAAARALAARARPAEAPPAVRPAEPSSAGAGQETGGPDPRASLADQIAGIVDVVGDLAEQAHVLAVGISIQSAGTDAPPALRAIADDVQLLAEQASRAVRQIEPLAQAAAAGVGDAGPGVAAQRLPAGLVAAAATVADQVAALAELAAGLRGNAGRLSQARDAAAASLGALADLAHRLRRATGRFRLPG